jgi:hypothetical protein
MPGKTATNGDLSYPTHIGSTPADRRCIGLGFIPAIHEKISAF